MYLKAEFVTPEKMTEIENRFQKNAFVDEVSYDKPLIQFLTKNIQQISFWLLIVSAFFGLISILLINSSLRLSVYSKRFNIKTMQMVGATKKFIRKPFIWQNIRLGMLGATLALIALGVVLYYVNTNFPELNIFQDVLVLVLLFGGVFGLGVIISWGSTHIATQRFLNLRTDDLYY